MRINILQIVITLRIQKKHIERFLSATIHENEIFNDDQHQYDKIGIRFLAELGTKIYALELERQKLSYFLI